MADDDAKDRDAPDETSREDASREDASGQSAPPAESAPPKKRKRKKKDEDAPSAPPPIPGEGTPEGAQLVEANAAFAAGNYARVRELATTLTRAADPAVVDAATALLRKIAPDPVQIGFLIACAVALGVITWIYVLS